MLRNVLKAAVLSVLLQETAHASCGCDLRVESFVNQGLSFDVVSSLIIGSRAAVIVDLPLAVAEAEKLARWVKSTTDKPLVAAFTTHNHPDHYLSGKPFLEHFPEAKHYATPEVAHGIRNQAINKTGYWSAAYGPGTIAPAPAIPTAYNFSFFVLPGDEACPVEILKNVGGDTVDISAFWIPSSRTLIAGDAVYGRDVHLWLADMLTPALTQSWLATLDFLGGLRALRVIPGHALTTNRFDASTDVEFTRRYVSFFRDRIEAKGPDFYTPRGIADLLEREFPGLTNLTSSNSSAVLLNITAENFGRGGRRMIHYFDLTAYNDTMVLDGWRL